MRWANCGRQAIVVMTLSKISSTDLLGGSEADQQLASPIGWIIQLQDKT